MFVFEKCSTYTAAMIGNLKVMSAGKNKVGDFPTYIHVNHMFDEPVHKDTF